MVLCKKKVFSSIVTEKSSRIPNKVVGSAWPQSMNVYFDF